MGKVEEKVREYISNTFYQGNDSSLTNETKLLSSGIIDSISALQLVEFLENEFHFEFEAHEVDQDNLDSIDIIVGFVEKKSSD